jgi:hypothetical protein
VLAELRLEFEGEGRGQSPEERPKVASEPKQIDNMIIIAAIFMGGLSASIIGAQGVVARRACRRTAQECLSPAVSGGAQARQLQGK